ncbi:iron-containing redox enzyme family protein [Sessilibacter corallicola]|uniref:iron-containing redox enzyme family protein n=1 Tax=Sessilibacter corallicola TaxID=2904075 RepID=UPI001E3D3F11|nr:iron-containing redox enzyme family protein [Sessilibacter corallicola]MCE2030345.1 iron-containing redox enzyme family protein [Sessilibacter corallicola]
MENDTKLYTIDDVKIAVDKSIDEFTKNKVFSALEAGTWGVKDYQSLLLTLFYQVYQGTMSFAAAASNCPSRFVLLREYLVHHAAEEMDHYHWIIDDLKSTGYEGPEPKDLLPSTEALAYVSFNVNNALHNPHARIASSLILEGLGQKYGGWFGNMVIEKTELTKDNLSFFLSHGETDKEHIVELWEVVSKCEMTSDEWKWMAHSAKVAGTFYKGMWDSSVS